MKRLIIALALVALVAVPAFASVQNVKVSGEIDSMWLVRDRFNLGTSVTNDATQGNDAYQNLFITQALVRIDADLTDNVGTTVQLINERSWGSNANEGVRVDLAYVTLKEMLYAPLSVTVGRQNLRYGNGFIIGDRDTNDLGGGTGLAGVARDLTKEKAFDAVKMVLDYHPLVIDVFAARITQGTVVEQGDHKNDVDLFGINANYQLGDKWNSVFEAYFFAKVDKNTAGVALNAVDTDKVLTPGLRASINPIKGLNLQAEGAWQGGTKATASSAATVANMSRNAIAGQFVSNYQLPFAKTEKYKPVTQTVYTFLSGESTPNDVQYGWSASRNEWNGWDPMFEDQAGGTIYNTLFDLTNAHILTSSIQASPIQDVTAKFSSTWIWLQKEVDFGAAAGGIGTGNQFFTMRQPDGTNITPRVTSNKDVGYEFDADFRYDYTEDVALGVSLGWFFPGNFFDSANDRTAKQFITSVDVKF
ncbi:MAG TPA: alginate export family protein [Candidatus Omnitrophota bacterium]|nr:alginate export family protein [Candidatus Omnitrophota bacterium]HPD83846.1 alginate export family protein [Candidatus Omnitrophota bacterium]HRZ02703.1 alginate export family protein [Candidatus Omnitrophota bacterium]